MKTEPGAESKKKREQRDIVRKAHRGKGRTIEELWRGQSSNKQTTKKGKFGKIDRKGRTASLGTSTLPSGCAEVWSGERAKRERSWVQSEGG